MNRKHLSWRTSAAIDAALRDMLVFGADSVSMLNEALAAARTWTEKVRRRLAALVCTPPRRCFHRLRWPRQSPTTRP